MFQRILVPLDGSLRAEYALPLAAQIARFSDGTLHLLRVVSPRLGGSSYLPSAAVQTMLEVDRAQANGYVQMRAASSKLDDVQAETDVRSGPAAATILSLAEACKVDLIVLCRYGQTGRTCWPLGGVAEKIIHGAGMPVLLVPNTERSSRRVRSDESSAFRVIVPLDGSYQAEAALLPAATLAMALSGSGRAATLCLAQVVKQQPGESQPEDDPDRSALASAIREGQTYLRSARDRLFQGISRAWNLIITCSVFPGSDVAETLLHTSEQGHDMEHDEQELHQGYDLIAMTTCGRGGIQQGMMGSIIGRMVRTTTQPLLSVHPK